MRSSFSLSKSAAPEFAVLVVDAGFGVVQLASNSNEIIRTYRHMLAYPQ